MKHILVLLVSCVFVCCGQNKNTSLDDAPERIEADSICCCPQSTIRLLPYDNFSKEESESLLQKIKKKFDKWLYGYWKFEIMVPVHLPQSSYVKERNRYKVTPILNYQSTL